MTAGSVSVPQVIPLRSPRPGKAKHEIDTETLVEIKSDTPEVSIYYTLDGSKPELIRKPGYGEHNTFKYKGPILLPIGKIMVKALAVTKDCRESTVVTKVFLVEYKQPNILFSLEDNDKNFLRDVTTQEREDGMFTTKPKKNGINVEIKPAWSETPRDFRDLETEKKSDHKSLQGPQLLTSVLETTGSGEESFPALPAESLQFAGSGVTSRKSLTSTQVARIQREIDFLRCAHCSAPRLSDPLAHFCQECGSPIPPVPVRRFPPPEGAQMAPCLECRHLVPMNTPTCVVCESPIAPQLQPQPSTCLKGKVICQACGTGNPLHHKHCVTCESKLPETQTPTFGGPPLPYLSQQGKTVLCSKCNRVNHSDARFCDWCGAKPDPPPCYFTCFKCGTNTRPYARFCGSCGIYIEPPSRLSSQNGVLMDAGDSLGFSETKPLQAQIACQPLPISLSKSRADLKETEDKGTQTVGLFYPSSKLLEKKELELVLHKEKLEKRSDRKPLLTAISPGKGYWRKQLDHVCAHLRSYAQNNLEFRALIGEPRMGKITSAAVLEDDSQVTITLNYALAANKDTSKPAKFNNHYLNSATEGRDEQDGSQTSSGKEDHNLSYSRGKIKRTKSRTFTEKEDNLPHHHQMDVLPPSLDLTTWFWPQRTYPWLCYRCCLQSDCEQQVTQPVQQASRSAQFSHQAEMAAQLRDTLKQKPESRQLLDELGPNGKGRITVIEQLLSEGADPSSTSEEDRPALTVAVLNRRAEAISLLVQKGADVDQQSGPHNTALHEAVLLGLEGEECIRALLGCKASVRKKNTKGRSAYDLAVTAGNNEVISLFARELGQGMLDKLTKPRNAGLVSS